MKATSSTKKRKRAKRGSGRIYKRDSKGKEYPADSPINAPYWIAYTIPNPNGGPGKRIREPLHDRDSKAITDRKTAEAERKRILAPYQTGDKVETLRAVRAAVTTAESAHREAIENSTPPLLLEKAEAAYLSSPARPDSGELTLQGYVAQWRHYAGFMAEHYPEIETMRDVGLVQVRAYVADLSDLSPSTYNQHINTLRRFWAVLSDEARTSENPWQKVQHKTVAKIERRHKVLTLDEASAIIEAAEGDLQDFLIMIATTGQRLQDIAKLKWANVDLDRGLISLVPIKTKRRSGKAVYIPVLPQARTVLESRQKKGTLVFPELSDLFDKDRGSALSKRIKAVVITAGLSPHEEGTGFTEGTDEDGSPVTVHTGQRAIVRISAHSLRHTFTTIARGAGIPDAIVRSIVGHSTASMTEHYTAFDEEMVAQLAGRFEALPAGSGRLIEQAGDHPAKQDEPLPAWAVELIRNATGRTWKKVQAELLQRGKQ